MKSSTSVKCQRHVLIWRKWDINWVDFFPSKDQQKWKWFTATFSLIKVVGIVYILLFKLVRSDYFLIDRKTKTDRIRRRQISAGLFLRPAQFELQQNWNSNYLRICASERRKCHGFDDGQWCLISWNANCVRVLPQCMVKSASQLLYVKTKRSGKLGVFPHQNGLCTFSSFSIYFIVLY